MRKIFYLFIALLPFFLNSCDKEPIAHFETLSGRVIYGVGENVHFTSNCVDAYEYVWDYGDGTVVSNSYQSNASHIYSYPGHYTVRLTVLSKRGKKSSSQTMDLTIRESGEMTFWMSQNCPGGVRVEFLDQTDYITGYYTSGVPSCGDTYCAYFANCPSGSFYFYATGGGYYWDNYITIEAGTCNKLRLSISSKGEAPMDEDGVIVLEGKPLEQ